MKHAPQLEQQRSDLQALLGSSLKWLHSAQGWLLTIDTAQVHTARGWLSAAARNVCSAAQVREHGTTGVAATTAIAFSHAGLRLLGLEPDPEFPFPTPFRAGMGDPWRARLLREPARQDWRWSDADAPAPVDQHAQPQPQPQPVHVLVMHWWDAARGPAAMAAPMLGDGFAQVRGISCPPSFFRDGGDAMFEPFGFRDGLVQPLIAALADPAMLAAGRKAVGAEQFNDRIVAPGEFVIGYRNEYDELTYQPELVAWRKRGPPAAGRFTRNGSYLAVQQIEQDVAAFAQLDRQYPVPHGQASTTERLIGRRRDGAPLGAMHASAPLDEQLDALRFRVADAQGFGCPLGAHTRRVNPRDALGHDVDSGLKASKLHRLLRRGRPYVDPSDDSQGIFFIACNTDLERQYEFVQQRWLRNPRFAGLEHEDDPLVGSSNNFSVPGLPIGCSLPLSTFTTTRGGGYFFLPGMAALDFIVGKPA